MVQKHSKLWITTAIRGRVDTSASQDYRNIVEGLQVCTVTVFIIISIIIIIITISLFAQENCTTK